MKKDTKKPTYTNAHRYNIIWEIVKVLEAKGICIKYFLPFDYGVKLDFNHPENRKLSLRFVVYWLNDNEKVSIIIGLSSCLTDDQLPGLLKMFDSAPSQPHDASVLLKHPNLKGVLIQKDLLITDDKAELKMLRADVRKVLKLALLTMTISEKILTLM